MFQYPLYACALAACFIIYFSYIGMLRYYGFAQGDVRQHDDTIRKLWWVVGLFFVVGIALIPVS